MLRQMLAVTTVLGLLAATLWWLRRKGLAHFNSRNFGRKPGRRMEMVERLALTPQHSLHLVRLGGRALLIARSPSGLTLLETSEWRHDERAPDQGAGR